MKKYLLIIILFAGLSSNAQQQELIENTWYLEKLEIDGVEYFTPENDHLVAVSATFYGGTLITNVCNELSGDIEFDDINNTFSNTSGGWGITMIDCTLQENQIFENHYFYEFWNINFTEIPNPFNYEIQSNGNSLALIVTNSEGGSAFYNNISLSTSDASGTPENKFLITFQNDNLIIQSNAAKAQSISIYDLSGKQILNAKVFNEKVNTQGLSSGIYLIQITDEKGNLFNKKIRKP